MGLIRAGKLFSSNDIGMDFVSGSTEPYSYWTLSPISTDLVRVVWNSGGMNVINDNNYSKPKVHQNGV